MTLDTEKSIFFGQLLIDAYLLQDELCLYGIIGHASAELAISKHTLPPFIYNYLCPLKNGSSHHLIIFPMDGYVSKTEPGRVKKAQEKKAIELNNHVKELRFTTSGHLRKYIENTEKFLNEMRNVFNNKEK